MSLKNKVIEAIQEEINKAESRKSYDADSHFTDDLKGYIRGLHRAMEIATNIISKPFWKR